MEIITENNQLEQKELLNLVQTISKKYDEFERRRSSQLNDIRMVRNAIYDMNIPAVNAWNTGISLPDAATALFTALSSPPQQGTCILASLMLFMSFAAKI